MSPSISRCAGYGAVVLPMLAVLFGYGDLPNAHGEMPQVQFDVDAIVAAKDISTEEFLEANPDEQLLEASIRVSSLIQRGRERDLLQYFFRLESPQRSIRIVDYAPTTTLDTPLAGNISVEKKEESNNHAGAAITGGFEWPVKVTGSGEIGSKTNETVRYERKPPLTPVTASGTVERGHGVYFKWKPSTSTSLEGAKELRIVFRAPNVWQGDTLHLTCVAVGEDRGLVRSLDAKAVCGFERFVIGLYAEGNPEAKAAAEELSRAETKLLMTVRKQQKAIEDRLYPSFAHKMGVMLDIVDPPVAKDWAERYISGGSSDQIRKIAHRLPPSVRDAVAQYSVARRQLSRLGTETTAEMQ